MDVSLKTENITLKKMANTHYSIALATSTVFQFERHVKIFRAGLFVTR